MIEELERLKKEYLLTEPSSYLASNGWVDLYQKLEKQSVPWWKMLFTKGLVFASLILLLAGGVTGAAQAAKPGDFLFPVKALSDNIVSKLTNNPTYALDNRAKDLIEKSNTGQNVQPAINEYQKVLQKAQVDAQKSGQTEEFKMTLDSQAQQFQNAQKEDGDKNQLQKVIDETQKLQGEVKGEKDYRNFNERTPEPKTHNDTRFYFHDVK